MEELRELLREAQWLLLPQKDAAGLDGGWHWFAPENGEAERFLGMLLQEQGFAAQIVLLEDALTRETVLLGADGEELERLRAEEDYHPAWALEVLATEGLEEGMAPEDYDPSRVWLQVWLVPIPLENTTLRGMISTPREAGRETPPSTPGEDRESPDQETSSAQPAPAFPFLFLSAATNAAPITIPASALRVVHVDAARGDDGWSGRQRMAANDGEGPKRSVHAGMDALEDGGGTLLVHEGIYTEGLDVRGRDIVARFAGRVVLKKTTPAATVLNKERSEP